MTCSSPQQFSGITPAQYATLIEKAKAAGIDISGNSGRAGKMGVEVEWNYSSDKQELVLTCLRAPFFMSPGAINTKLHALVSEALTA